MNSSRPLLYTTILFVFLVNYAAGQQTTHGERPNILWIVANDLSNDLHCYGNKLVQTPNLDKLAEQGTRFTNLISVGAVCSPSRSAFITGMHAVSINSHNHTAKRADTLANPICPITTLLKHHGYFVTNSGEPEMNGPYKTGYNFKHDAEQMYDGFSWNQRNENQPFFAQVHLSSVHRPFKRDIIHPINVEDVELPPYYPDHILARQDWAMYLETIQIMDREVGEILDKLRRDGLDKNTVVFFFADHGRAHIRDKQFLYEGGVNVPLLIRWPDEAVPGKVNDRLISNIDIAASTLEIAGIEKPAYMQGVSFIGKHSAPNKYVFAARDRCDGTVDRIRMIRSDEYKLILNFYPERPYMQFNYYKWSEYPMWTLVQVLNREGFLSATQSQFTKQTRPKVELYNLIDDPHEINNLANDAEYGDELAELQEALNEWIVLADKGIYPELGYDVLRGVEEMENARRNKLNRIGISSSDSDEQIDKEYLEYWKYQMSQLFP